MFTPATHGSGPRRRRLGFTEVLLIVGILAFSAFTLVNDGHQTFGTLLSGFEDVVGG